MRKLMIVDDEVSIIEIIRAYFEDNGYEVIGAKTAEAAFELLIEEPDLILLDIMMPGMDGIEFCKQVREQALCPMSFS